jgi:peptide/nickel transport system substrate-binding protein
MGLPHRVAALLFAGALAALACLPNSTPVDRTEVTRGGTLTVAWWSEPSGLTPYVVSQLPARILSHFALEGLVAVSPDAEYQPWLARQVPTVANGDVRLLPNGRMDVTYRLMPDIHWSDGQPFSSDDVKYTWQFVMREPTVFSREGFDRIESIETPDALTAILHFREVYAPYLILFEFVLPRHVLEGAGDVSKTDYGRKPLGTGPFRVAEFAAGDHLTLERNMSYRNKDRPILDRIVFRFIASRDAAVLQLKAGEVDAMWSLLESQAADLEKTKDVQVLTGPSSQVWRLEFNLAKPGDPSDPNIPHPVLGDIAIRRALTLATPKRQIVDSLLSGKGDIANSLVSIGWAAPQDLMQESYDPAKAKEVLDRAGWTTRSDGIRAKGSTRASLTISTVAQDSVRERIEQVLLDEWKAVGVELKIRNFPTAVLFAAGGPVRQGDFDVDMYAEALRVDPHVRLAERYHTKSIPRPENKMVGLNWNRFGTPEMDRLLERAAVTIDSAERVRIYRQLLGLVNDQYLNVWLYAQNSFDALRSNVGGYGRSNPWMTFGWDAENWFVRRT